MVIKNTVAYFLFEDEVVFMLTIILSLYQLLLPRIKAYSTGREKMILRFWKYRYETNKLLIYFHNNLVPVSRYEGRRRI